MMKTSLHKWFGRLGVLSILVWNSGCDKFLEVAPPKSKIEADIVFNNQITATAALLGIYSEMVNSGNAITDGGSYSMLAWTGLASDELTHNSPDIDFLSFQNNNLNPEISYIERYAWTFTYKLIYQANAIIEAMDKSTELPKSLRDQLSGEAYFLRAFAHFYLVNLFGDVPLVLITDYKANATVTRTPKAIVYDQIKKDVLKAEELLSDKYPAANEERIRPNKLTARAFLARVYLYLEEWENAEASASAVIGKTDVYSLKTNLDEIFLKNSTETIWQLNVSWDPAASIGATREAMGFSPYDVPRYNSLSNDLIRAFETGDDRITHWLDTLLTPNEDTIWRPVKYKQYDAKGPATEYSMIIRLAEIILIRAEARVRLNNLTGTESAASDINKIRHRAGLDPTTATTATALMAAIEQERRVELFAEVGAHRWLDLIRWKRADAVLGPKKGANWQPTDVLFPLPLQEMNSNPFLKPQNDGY